MDEKEQREELMKRLKRTRRNEGICFQGWQAEILVRWIEELTKKAEKGAE